MVTALSRKEANPSLTIQVSKPSPSYLWQQIKPIKTNDDFPYALREFINTRMNLPSFDEIIGKTKQTLETCGQKI